MSLWSESVASIIPVWLQNRPGFRNGFKFVWVLAAQLDMLNDVAIQAVKSWFPGVGTDTALPAIGESRGIKQGIGESNQAYALRLRVWLDDWTNAGSAEQLAKQIWKYTQTTRVRVINRAGKFVTIDSGGITITEAGGAWDWDSHSTPSRAGNWSDLWVVVYPSVWSVAGNINSRNAAEKGVYGIGHEVGRADFDAIRSILAEWKSAHSYIVAVVWCSDATLFDPTNLSAAGNPDGTWGDWAKYVNGVLVPARNSTLRYWTPEK